MSDQNDDTPIENKVEYIEQELKLMRREMIKLTEEFMGTITILCLPLTDSRRLELGFKQISELPNAPLKVIVRRYVMESKMSDLKFDDMVDPMVRMLGFERLWKILDAETIKNNYGDWALSKWQEMAKNHPCEE